MRTRKSYGTRNIIGRSILRIRKSQGLKQHEFLARLQVAGLCSAATLSKIEGQQQGVRDVEIVAISKVLGVPIQKLFEGRETVGDIRR